MKSKIILLYEPEQVETILSFFNKEKLAQEKFLIIALEYEVESLLKRHGISFHSLREYLKPDSFYDNHDKASEFLRKLYDAPELSFFKYFDIELLKVKGPDILHYIKQIINCLE